jgi:hypothetical protein
MKIATEGSATRILVHGNGTNKEGIWTSTIEKINSNLKR